MNSHLLVIAIFATTFNGIHSAAVRVKMANNPYIYEIAKPAPDAIATPVHPATLVAAAAENRARIATPRTSADLRSPVANRVVFGAAAPAEETTTETAIPKPYKIAYDSVDANGTQMRREETKDDKGVVRGSYSYTDPFGIFRVVEYIADENGFRASIRTNEPGIGKADNGDPASVIYEIDPHPSAAAASAASSGARRAASSAAARA